jgi:hypothetical protein
MLFDHIAGQRLPSVVDSMEGFPVPLRTPSGLFQPLPMTLSATRES